MIRTTTIRQGQRVAIWDQRGGIRYQDGPKRLWLFRQSLQSVDRVSAESHEYLVIRRRDGSAKHIAGPATVWRDLVEHESITVRNLVAVGADQALEIYGPAADGADEGLDHEHGSEQRDRRMLRGPAQFMPDPDEQFNFIKPRARYSAESDEYLVVRHHNGRAHHVAGPAQAWFDPIEHESIDVQRLLPVDANEAVVVYARDAESGAGAVARRVLRGPAQYMPEPNEWLHKFRWHGSDPKNPRRKVPRTLNFSKLRVIPDQMYVDVTEVRTADDALLTMQVMIFFELSDIERMLDQTHDPIADFLNAVTADVIDFASDRNFEVFKRDTEQLNDLGAYPHLTSRAERIGYRINKVIYRGYEANPKLQAMHDHAIESRTALQLEAETKRQAQELADLKLQREAQRAEQHRAIERADPEHQRDLKQRHHDQSLLEQRAEHDLATACEKESNAIELEHLNAKNAEQTVFLGGLRGLEVDLSRYLVAQYQHPDRLVRIDASTGEPAQIHLHDGEGVPS